MSKEYLETLDPKVLAAVTELQQLVSAKYPSAIFYVAPGEESPESTYVTATVDIEAPDDVVDLVIERVLAMQLDDGIPVHLIPIRTINRVLEMRKAEAHTFMPPSLSRVSTAGL